MRPLQGRVSFNIIILQDATPLGSELHALVGVITNPHYKKTLCENMVYAIYLSSDPIDFGRNKKKGKSLTISHFTP
ncbi:MAG: hypothetical protein ACI8ZN_002425 [Bacteroidia bacterium]|jgi:hypothetical protein